MRESEENLSRYCHYGWSEKLRNLLDNDGKDLDLLRNEGELFSAAAKWKPEILEILLEYYAKYKLSGSPESHEYKLAKSKLMDVVDYIFDSDISYSMKEETKELLAPYKREEEESSCDLSEFEEAEDEVDALLRGRTDSEDRRSEGDNPHVPTNESVVIGLENIICEPNILLIGDD